MKYFYSHIVEIGDLHSALEGAGFEDHERKELVLLVEDSMFHVVVNTVLTELPEEDKKKFLTHLHEDDNVKLWSHLREKIDGVEDKIRVVGEKFLATLHKDIKSI